jgi:hypothetical protein
MADIKISNLPAATTPLAGTEVLPIVQSGTTKKVAVTDLTAGRAVSTQNLEYTGTLTGSTGVINIGAGQIIKDAAGNLGLGVTPSAWAGIPSILQMPGGASVFGFGNGTNVASNTYFNSGYKYVANAAASRYELQYGGHLWFTAPSGTAGNAISFTQSMTLDDTGNLGIGTVSPTAGGKLDVNGIAYFGTGDKVKIYSNNVLQNAGALDVGTLGNAALNLITNNSTKVTIDTSGNLLVSTASAFLQLKSASTTFDISAQAGGNDFLRISANGTQRFQFNDLGAAYNSTGTWGTISDVRLKENIVESTPKLEGINQLRVVNFNLKTDPDVKQIGFIAQEVEQIFPGLVADGEEDGEGGYYKSVKTTVLIPMLVKAIQEQQTLIQDLTTRLSALEAK